LYAYTLTLDIPEDDDDEGGLDPIITSIALHRIVAVCAGVLWGMFITSYIWPISARYDMRVGLSELYLHLGWFFRTNKDDGVVAVKPMNGGMLERADASSIGRIRPFLNTKQELALQGLLIHLKGLLGAAANEPRLKVLNVPHILTYSRVHSQSANIERCYLQRRTFSTHSLISE
jgi:hypothetical protein